MASIKRKLRKFDGLVKAQFLKRKRSLVAPTSFITTYFALVGIAWAIGEPITHFKEGLLKQILGGYWWVVIYITPVPIALAVAVLGRYRAFHPQFLEEFDYKTAQVINRAQLTITGTGKNFERKEVQIVESQLQLCRPVLITGDSGTGKSGIGVVLTRRAQANKQPVLLIDAREVQHFQDENSLRRFYNCDKPLSQKLAELGSGFRLVIDQLDNTVGKPISDVLINVAIECSKVEGIQVVVISRKREAHEVKLLNKLLQNNFAEIECRELDDQDVGAELKRLGFEHPQEKLIAMCKNLLNLEILSTIKTKNPAFTPKDVEDEVALWETYLDTLQDRESGQTEFENAEKTINEAMKLAMHVLTSEGQDLTLTNPLSSSHRRLISSGVIVHEDGVRYRFRHEKLQDYLFARYGADQGYMPPDILAAVGPIRSRNTLVWLGEIYHHRKSPLYMKFLEGILNA